MRLSELHRLQQVTSELTQCEICCEPYDRHIHEPLIICSMHHSLCRHCMRRVETTQKCPFCREKINFNKIVRNNYIYNLLPNDYQEDRPYDTSHSSPTYPNHDNNNNNYPLETQPDALIINNNPNNNPNSPPELEQYVPLPRDHEDDDNDHYYNDSPYQEDTRWHHFLRNVLELRTDHREFVYLAVFVLQLPFMFFDLYFALVEPHSECMDVPHETSFYVLRHWLFAMGYMQLGFVIIITFSVGLKAITLLNLRALKTIEMVVTVLIAMRILVWSVAELEIFFTNVQTHCHGGIYAYFCVLTVLHIALIVLICVLGNCK